MADVKFNNRGWSTTSEDAQTPMKANVVNLSEHARIDPTGRIDRLLFECNPSAAEKHQCNGNCKCAKLGKNCHPILCGCRGRCYPPVDAQSVPVGKGLQLVMANEVDPGGDGSDEPETSSDDDCEWRSSTSSEESRGSHGDTAEDILEWYLDRMNDVGESGQRTGARKAAKPDSETATGCIAGGRRPSTLQDVLWSHGRAGCRSHYALDIPDVPAARGGVNGRDVVSAFFCHRKWYDLLRIDRRRRIVRFDVGARHSIERFCGLDFPPQRRIQCPYHEGIEC